MSTNPQFPSSKKNHDIVENEAGSLGSKGSAPLEVTRVCGEDGVEFGTFANVDSTTGRVEKVASGDTAVHGIALISNHADDYANRKYNIDDQVALARREYFFVKIDEANKPDVGGEVRISNKAGIKGYLTSDAADSKAAAEGITIEAVFDTVAEVYLEGKASIALA